MYYIIIMTTRIDKIIVIFRGLGEDVHEKNLMRMMTLSSFLA
jgi:hypothetical protein